MPQTSAAAFRASAAGFFWRFAIGALVSLPAFGQVTMNLSWDASTNVLTQTERDQITSHLSEAMRRWSQLLAIHGPRSGQHFLGSHRQCSERLRHTGKAGGRSLLEQSVAYELRTGNDADGAEPDMYLDIGLDYLRNSLWFDPDPASRTAPVPFNCVDALSVLLQKSVMRSPTTAGPMR